VANSHKRETNARRNPPAVAVVGSLALLATVAVVTVGVAVADPPGKAPAPISAATSLDPAASRDPAPVTRSFSRQLATQPKVAAAPTTPPAMSKQAITAAVSAAHVKQWTTTDLNLWSEPGDKASQVGEIAAGKQVLVTGRTFWGRTEIVVDGKSRWVTDGYLSDDKPLAAGAGLSHEPCPDMAVENRLTAGAIYVYRSVCHAFPQITTYGGWAPRGEHASGKALDIMTSDVALGTAIAQFLQDHASELDLFDVIWRQHIWTPVRASEGWRLMPSRGSETANHYDHVHVSVN
jgi:hypothetical protein